MANKQSNNGSNKDQSPDLMNEHDVPIEQMEDLQRTLADSDEPEDTEWV